MGNLDFFPHLNASLNGLSGLFLIAGFYFIKQRKIELHRASMLSAVVTSAVFLVSYLSSKVVFGMDSVKFTGTGFIRPIYFFILITHTILAALMVPFILLTLWKALKGKYEIHRKLARWVFPVWLYVSITGVLVYLLLYQLFPSK
jgi:putative membrane protein